MFNILHGAELYMCFVFLFLSTEVKTDEKELLKEIDDLLARQHAVVVGPVCSCAVGFDWKSVCRHDVIFCISLAIGCHIEKKFF